MRSQAVMLILVAIAVAILVALLAGGLTRGFFGQINQALVISRDVSVNKD